jgi:hypothetical protein
MADTTATLSNQNGATDLTPEQAKELHKKLNQFYRKRNGGKTKAKAVIKPRGKVEVHQKAIAIEESATDFDDINDEPFSLTPNNVSQIWVKTGKERMKCVNTGKSLSVGGAAVYRVFL